MVVHLDTLEIKVLDSLEGDMSPGQVGLPVLVLLPLISLVTTRLKLVVRVLLFARPSSRMIPSRSSSQDIIAIPSSLALSTARTGCKP